MSPTTQINGWKATVIDKFAEHGPWALMTLIILTFVGWEMHRFVDASGTVVAQYVGASRNHLEKLCETMTRLEALLEPFRLVPAEHAAQTQMLMAISDQMRKHDESAKPAIEAAAVAAEANKRMIELLEQIRDINLSRPPPQ